VENGTGNVEHIAIPDTEPITAMTRGILTDASRVIKEKILA
jgi:hypothetical protein